jgi:hypothetical protein
MGLLEAKRIVVTGGAGFLGSFVVEKLRGVGAGEIFVPGAPTMTSLTGMPARGSTGTRSPISSYILPPRWAA